MNRFFGALAGLVILAACAAPEPQVGPDGQPLPKVYNISAADTSRIQFRMLDGINALRADAGAQPVAFNSQLNASAKSHSQDMSQQNRPWHFSADGTSPIDRVARAGYTGQLIGENISETYETELETLSAWMDDPNSRAVIMDPRANEIGFSWYQEPAGRIWWTLVVGQGATPGAISGIN